MNPLKGFDLHAGVASHDQCRLWLAGEQINPTKQAVLIFSGDGGTTIQVVTSLSQAFSLWQVAVSQDSMTIWLAGISVDGKGLLLKSTDGGVNWQEPSLPVSTTILSALTLTEDRIWVAGKTEGSAMLLTSTDGGSNWREALRITSAGEPEQRAELFEIATVGSTVMVVGTDGVQGIIAISQDGGATFQMAPNLGEFTEARNVSVIDAEQAYVGGYFSPNGLAERGIAVFLKTPDGGLTWEKLTTPANSYLIVDQLFTSREHGFVLTGNALYSVNMAEGNAPTWEAMSLNPAPSFGGPTQLIAAGDGTLYAIGISGTGIYRLKP